MKLAAVTLPRPVKIGSDHTAELSAERFGVIEYDERTRLIKVSGQLIDSAGAVMQPLPPEFPCPECNQMYHDLRARGAHRYQAHGVKGTSRE